ncbi:MAG: hypothetical protein HONBIEJF_02477 [Fimbriimonadaceae bacterium]|nr:hypothetical protein [Fimbriimonadaceae bacterium]
MTCPRGCGAQLLMMDRSGIEVDYCPTCRGVWLDRGELDKLIDRAAGAPSFAPDPGAPAIPTAPYPPSQGAERRRDWDDDDDYRGNDRRRKRKGILSEIFDFD